MGLFDVLSKWSGRSEAAPQAGAERLNQREGTTVWDQATYAANQFAAAQATGVVVYRTKGDMLADTSQRSGAAAWVLLDADPVNNASYSWDGTSWRGAFDRLALAIGNGSGFQQAGDGAVLRPLQDKSRDQVHVKDFGARGDGADDTVNLQKAIDSTPDGGVLAFARTRAPFQTEELRIGRSIRIEMNGAKFALKGSRLFVLSADVEFCEIVGCGGVDVGVGPGAESTREFFSDWTLTDQRDYSNINSGARHCAQRLVIERNIVNAAKITVVGSHRSLRIAGNVFVTSSSDPFALPYVLMVAPGKNAPDRAYGEFVVADNHWDVWSPSQAGQSSRFFDGNYDILKLARGTTGLKLRGNFIRNGNPDQYCPQVDVFTGAHFLNSSGNTFINVQLHRKQMVGAVSNPDFGMDTYANDQWIVQSGFKLAYATGPHARNNPIYLHGARAEFVGCKVLNECDAPMSVFFLPAFSSTYPGFGVKGTTHVTVIGGIYDLRSDISTNDSAFMHGGASIPDQANEYIKLLGPTIIGGRRLLRSTTSGCRFRNCQRGFVTWTHGGSEENADVDVDFDYPQVAVGNMYDNGAHEVATHDANDQCFGYIRIAASSSESLNINAFSAVRFDGAGALRDLSGGRVGRRLTIHKIKSAGAVLHGTSVGAIRLSGGTDFAMDPYSVLHVELQPDGVWNEVGRVDSRRKIGPTAHRPESFAPGEAFSYFDTTIGKPVFWNAGWWDAMGGRA